MVFAGTPVLRSVVNFEACAATNKGTETVESYSYYPIYFVERLFEYQLNSTQTANLNSASNFTFTDQANFRPLEFDA